MYQLFGQNLRLLNVYEQLHGDLRSLYTMHARQLRLLRYRLRLYESHQLWGQRLRASRLWG